MIDIDIELLRLPFGIQALKIRFNVWHLILNNEKNTTHHFNSVFFRGYDRVVEIFAESKRIQLPIVVNQI